MSIRTIIMLLALALEALFFYFEGWVKPGSEPPFARSIGILGVVCFLLARRIATPQPREVRVEKLDARGQRSLKWINSYSRFMVVSIPSLALLAVVALFVKDTDLILARFILLTSAILFIVIASCGVKLKAEYKRLSDLSYAEGQ